MGSSSITTAADGTRNSEIRYSAFGETRYSSGITPTDYRYTGQLEQADVNLYYYNARYYDAALGRFVQADTIIPGAGDSKSYDRYTYVNNNPVRFVDPSGHANECGYNGTGGCPHGPTVPTLVYDQNGISQSAASGVPLEDIRNGVNNTWALVEFLLTVVSDPADMIVSVRDCISGQCSPLMLLGLLPIIPSSLGKHVDDLVDVEKVIDDLPNNALVCRGGTCEIQKFLDNSNNIIDSEGKLVNASVNSAPGKTVEELAENIPNNQIGVTTVEEVRNLGGNVVPSPSKSNPYHATLSGITPQQAQNLLTPTIQNPISKSLRKRLDRIK